MIEIGLIPPVIFQDKGEPRGHKYEICSPLQGDLTKKSQESVKTVSSFRFLTHDFVVTFYDFQDAYYCLSND